MKVQFDYQFSPGIYRKMYYFNAFFVKGIFLCLFIITVWIAAVSFLILELMHIVNLSRVMHFCFLIVTISPPILIISLEVKLRQIKDSDLIKKNRSVIFSDDGINYHIDSKTKGQHDSWDDIAFLYETNSMFIIAKDEKYSIPVLKTGVPKEELEDLSQDLRIKLGGRYKRTNYF